MAVNFNPTGGDLTGAKDRARVGGSGFTVWAWENQVIAFARQISHQSPAPVGPGAVPIHPMNEPYPLEIVTPQAATMGQITLELYELYGAQVWERLAFLGGGTGQGPVDIVGVFKAVSNASKPITVVKYIKPPALRGGKTMAPYTEEYHNTVVTQVMDGETVEVGTMEVLKQMTLAYTHMTRNGKNDILGNQTNLGVEQARESSGTVFGQ